MAKPSPTAMPSANGLAQPPLRPAPRYLSRDTPRPPDLRRGSPQVVGLTSNSVQGCVPRPASPAPRSDRAEGAHQQLGPGAAQGEGPAVEHQVVAVDPQAGRQRY